MVVNPDFREGKELLAWGNYGSCPLLATAPHRFKYFDEGIIKLGEPLTGEIAKGFAKSLQAAWCVQKVAVPVARVMEGYLKDLPQDFWVVDFHGMRDNQELDVCLGLGPRPAQEVIDWGREIQELCAKNDILVYINTPFAACSPHAITRLAQQRNMKAMQVEISRAMRSRGNPRLGVFLKILEKTCPAF